MLKIILPAPRVGDRGLQAVGEPDNLVLRPGASGAAEKGDAVVLVKHPRQKGKRLVFRNDVLTGIRGEMHQVLHFRRGVRDVSGQDDNAHVAPGPRMLDGGHQDAGSLGPFGNQFRIRTAFPEKLFRMRGLEIFQAYLALRNVGGDGQHGSVAPVGVKQAVDQMEVAGAAAAAADSQVPAQLGFRARGKGGGLFMPHMDPFNGLFLPQRIRDRVQAVPYNAVNALDACPFQDFNDLISYPVHAD